MSGRARPRILCACCGEPGTYGGFGWRTTCYSRWRNAGRPEGGPPPAPTPEVVRQRAAAASRGRQDVGRQQRKAHAIKLARRSGTPRQIARRLGVTERTVFRYLAEPRPAVPVPSGVSARPRAHQGGGSMAQVYQHDADWLIGQIRCHERQYASPGDSFDAKLGAVPHWDLNPEAIHDLRIRVLCLRIGEGETRPAALHETLQALGVGADLDPWLADVPLDRAS